MQARSPVDQCNCFALRQAARHVTRLYERHLAGAGLTSAQFSLLAALAEAGRMTMSELPGALVMDRTTLLRAMKPLQRAGLLRSGASETDPRQLVYSLTSSGERRLQQALPLWTQAQREFEAGIGPRQAAQLRRSLLGIARND